MSSFKERQEAFEKEFAHGEHLKFKAGARRNKLLGLWVAEKLGIAGAQADTYASEIVAAEVHGGEAGVIDKVTADLKNKGITSSPAEIKAKMNDLMKIAIEQVKTGT